MSDPVVSPFAGFSTFVWKVKNTIPGVSPETPQARALILDRLQHNPWHSLLIKVADGVGKYNLRPVGNLWKDDILPLLYSEMGAAGLPRLGWQYVYHDSYRPPEYEAALAVERITQFALDGWIVDAEAQVKVAGAAAARRYMAYLRGQLPNLPIALCSYRFPSKHRDFPWMAYLDYLDPQWGDVHMPQVYWEGTTSVQGVINQVQQSAQELRSLKDLPLVFVFPLYERGGWHPTRDQLEAAHTHAKLYGIGESSWSWDSQLILNGPKYEWWHYVNSASKEWGPPAPPPGIDPIPRDEKIDLLWNEAKIQGWNLP